MPKMLRYDTIEEYIASLPDDQQKLIKIIRDTVKKAAPEATERMSYGMPSLYLNGNLIYYGAFKNHIGFFPTAQGVAEFEKELSGYHTTKGTIQFPYDKPLPIDLIEMITKFRADQNHKLKKP